LFLDVYVKYVPVPAKMFLLLQCYQHSCCKTAVIKLFCTCFTGNCYETEHGMEMHNFYSSNQNISQFAALTLKT